jgi:hypothetical protein
VPLKLGIESTDTVEVLGGLNEGAKFVNNGASAVRNNDQLLFAGQGGGEGGGNGGRAGRGGGQGPGRGGRGGQGQAPKQ